MWRRTNPFRTGIVGKAVNLIAYTFKGMTPLDVIDPYHERWWGMHRIMVNADFALDIVKARKMARGDTAGISAKDQYHYKVDGLDLSESNAIEEMKRKLRERNG